MIADDPLVLMVEAIDRAQVTAGLAEKAATTAAEKAMDGTRRLTALEEAAKALAGEVRGWRQDSLKAAEARRQARWRVVASVAGGLLLYPILAATLPYGGYLAAGAVNGRFDRWKAGIALVKAARPRVWHRLEADRSLVSGTPANAKAIADCQKLAGDFGTAQSCMITVPAP